MKKILMAWLLAVVANANSFAVAPSFPAESQNLKLTAPVRSWDEALPLGNGLMGGLLWGEGNTVRLSLDRGDLWDERPYAEPGWWKKRNWKVGGDWDEPYWGATPTKLPAGRLEITLDSSQKVQSFELNLATAEGYAHFTGGQKLTGFYSAVEPVALFRITGPEPKELFLIPSGAKKQGDAAVPSGNGAVSRLGYPAAKFGNEGRAQWYVQDAVNGFKYCACVETKRVGNEMLVAVTVTSTNDGADVLALARQRCSAALAKGYAGMLKPHASWWREFWAQSSVNVPEPEIQKYYVLCRYYYGAASRRGAPPMPLQGVWTADNGELPPWKGDYHNDLNTQMTYIGYHGAGNFDEGACYLDFLWNLEPTFREFAKDFYGTGGLAVPGVMSLAGQPLGGWGQYSLSPTMTSWSAHLFYLHWRYTMDEKFLRDRAYPWCKEAGECLKALLKPNANGVLVLQRSSSPEIFDNSSRAWLIPNSNYDLMSLKMQFLSLAEMADALGKKDEAKTWSDTAAALGDYHTDATGMLLIDAKTPLPYSHRHLSNLMGLFPFNLITCDGGEKDNQRIKASLANWDKSGTSQWCGYSWSWMSCLRARVGDAETAVRDLDVFVKAFILRNGFHVNGDQTRSGFSTLTYRPFTLEGNFLAMQAVHEMLLQSWSPTPGKRDTEIIRIFPATPWRWHNASFTDLRTEGGHRVSASRQNNATRWFRVIAGKEGVVRIRDNFDQRSINWNRRDVKKVGDNFEVTLKKGATLEATLSIPREIPTAPANVAEPVMIHGASGISTNTLLLHIGAASDDNNQFNGDIARVLVEGRTLNKTEINTSLTTIPTSSGKTKPVGRGQWTTEEAWAWHRKVGVIRGFNAAANEVVAPAYPGMPRTEILRRAAAIGYNSVRFWYNGNMSDVRKLIDEAAACGLTVSLVIPPPSNLGLLAHNDEKALAAEKAYIQGIIGEFRNDPRIVLWDLYNEPKNWGGQFRLIMKRILWAREMGPIQPLTASIYHWLPDIKKNYLDRVEAEAMVDVHNFHLYDCSADGMAGIEEMVATLKKISDRPMVCTECLARSRGDTFGRILPAFSKHQIHWYNWGLYACDANWTVSWDRSAFDPNEPWFHEVLHPDGTPYDWRDLELIRNFHFARPGEDPDPGVEVTDRWLKERAWKWVNVGPVRGWTYRAKTEGSWGAFGQPDAAGVAAMERDLSRAQESGCDSLRVHLEYAVWKANPEQFRKGLDAFLKLADRHGMTVTPVLMTDAQAQHPSKELTKYVSEVVKAFGFDARIYCWELYHRPGGDGLAKDKARALLCDVFRAARLEFPNQPLTATPAVCVENFTADFDYRKALSHRSGLEYNGWNKLHHQGTSDAELCAYVWGLSDVLSLASNRSAPETGWLLTVANRYGRPVICTEWTPPEAASVEETLKLFSVHHVQWYAATNAVFDAEIQARQPDMSRLVKQFHYKRLMTPRQ